MKVPLLQWAYTVYVIKSKYYSFLSNDKKKV